MAGKGLYANIHAKRKRGGKMRKKGAKGLFTRLTLATVALASAGVANFIRTVSLGFSSV